MPHSCAAAMSSITAGPESLSAGTAIRSPAPKSRIVPIAGIARYQHVGAPGDSAERADRRRAAGRVGGRGDQERHQLGSGEIGLPGGKRVDRRGFFGSVPAHGHPTEPHRFGGAFDQPLVFHDEQRQRRQIDRPQQPHGFGFGTQAPRPGHRRRADGGGQPRRQQRASAHASISYQAAGNRLRWRAPWLNGGFSVPVKWRRTSA